MKCALGVDVVIELVQNDDRDYVDSESDVDANAVVVLNPTVELP